jgi:hypothetical protein
MVQNQLERALYYLIVSDIQKLWFKQDLEISLKNNW